MTKDCAGICIGFSPYLDGELDAAERGAFERHVADCDACRAALAEARTLSAAMRADIARERAPARLAARLSAALDEDQGGMAARRWYWRAPALAAASLMLLLLGAAIGRWALPPAIDYAAQDEAAGRDALAAHVRGLLSERTIDVASSDRHTVKPWFEGRVELAPPVEDLTADGYRLVGGRVDFVGGRRVAALVYRHRLHALTLFVGPAQAGTTGPIAVQGYRVIHWNQGGLGFWAVSDLDAADLQKFTELLRVRLGAQ